MSNDNAAAGCCVGVAFLGHVDCGKTTLIARVLNKKIVNYSYGHNYHWKKFEGVDNEKAEQERGITIVPKWFPLKVNEHSMFLVDSPGHRDFINSFITAMCGCKCAILVVAAPTGEFEAGMSRYGQTREHLLIAFTLGIKNLLIVISKMKQITQNRYNEIAQEIIKYAQRVGYKDFQVIPADSWDNVNIDDTSNNQSIPWYQGPTVLQALSEMVKKSSRNNFETLPLRLAVTRKQFVGGIGPVAEGALLSGTLKEGQTVWITPSVQKPDPAVATGNWKLKRKTQTKHQNEPIKCVVKNIESFHQNLKIATAGLFVGVSFQHSNRQSMLDFKKTLKRGQVITASRVKPVNTFRAMIIVMNGVFREKYTPYVHFHTEKIACRVIKIRRKIDRRTGKEIPLTPEIKTGEAAVVDLRAAKYVSLTSFSDFNLMGRLLFTDKRMVVAVGKVIPSMIPWELARYVWAGHLKNPQSPFARMPGDMIKEILRVEI